MELKLASWNVNSLRVRLPHLLDWLATAQPDLLALQETKLVDADFPLAVLHEAGYEAAFAGQKSYNGVAVLSRLPLGEVVTDLPGLDDPQRRVLGVTATLPDGRPLRFYSLYVPNGSEVGSDKYRYKLDWLRALHDHLAAELHRWPLLAAVGDYNIIPQPEDVHDPQAWEGQVLFTEAERAALQGLLDLGLSDLFRCFEQPAESYSWWDYRQAAFRRNRGARIDHLLASAALRDACTACSIDRAPRALERPSDHAPVVATFRPGRSTRPVPPRRRSP